MVGTRVRPALEVARDRALEEEGERYNPIRPSNGNQIVGGAYGATSRSTRHSMADKRAMEIQMRNQTPGTGATPVMGVSQFRGGSATPSMGLSEFRGGGSMEELKDFHEYLSSLPLTKLKKAVKEMNKESKSSDPDDYYTIKFPKGASKEDILKECKKADPSKESMDIVRDKVPAPKMKGGSYDRCVGGSYERMVGGNYGPSNVSQSGAYQGQGRRRNSSASDIMSSAHLTARELSDHIMKQHGKKYHREFMEGMMRHGSGLHGGGWWGDMWNKIKNEVGNKESRLRKDIIPKAAEYTAKAAPVLDAAGAFVGAPGVGTALASGAQGLHRVNEGAKALGFGRCGGRKKRAPASAGDGRRKRADIVRKVMADRGVKMIEASKIVKAEGLY